MNTDVETWPNKALETTGFCVSLLLSRFSMLVFSPPVSQLQTTAASPRVVERSECMLIVSGLSAAVSELGRSAGSGRPVCKHSVEAGRESSSTADARRLTQILSCVSRDSRLHSQRSDIAGGHCVFPENEGPEILE